MLGGKDEKFGNQCRICSSSEAGQLKIFDSDGLAKNIQGKIQECLSITVKEGDSFPKGVCLKCVDLLEKFHEFRLIAIRSERTFESMLKTAISRFPLEPECCLQEVDNADTQKKNNGPVMKIDDSKNDLIKSVHKTVPQIGGLKDLTIMAIDEKKIDDNAGVQGNCIGDGKSRFSDTRLGNPGPDDYVMMKEETFTIDNKRLTPVNVEFLRQEKDNDIVLSQKRRREVMPPMWDVYERFGKDSTVVIQRRYIVNKAAFPCSLCNKCFSVTQGHPREGKSEESSGDEGTGIHFFSCHECGKVFPRRSSLKRHQLIHSELAQMYSCPICGKAFGRKEHLSRHMLSHTGGRPYCCEVCNKPFVRKEHLDRHRLSHLNLSVIEKQGSESASGSPETSAAPSDDSGTTIDRPYPCDICHQTFIGSDQLLRHQKRMHNIGADGSELLKHHICTICLKSFSRKEHLVRHQKIHQRDFLLAAGSLPPVAISSLVPQVFKHEVTNGSINLDQLNLKIENTDGPIENNYSVFNGHAENFGVEKSPAPSISNEPDVSPLNMEPEISIDEQQDVLKSEICFEDDNTFQDSDSPVPNMDCDARSNSATPVSMPPTPVVQPPLSIQPIPSVQSPLTIQPTPAIQPTLTVQPTPTIKPSPPMSPVVKHPCPACVDKSFSSRSHLFRHFKNAHPDQPLTLALASSKSAQDNAYKHSMLNNGRHWCKFCDKTFGRRYHLVRHMKVHGPDEQPKPFRCSACNTSFVSHELFQGHICNPQNSVPTLEEEAPAGENSQQAVHKPAKREKRKRSRGNYECVTCGINFSRKKLLKRHEESAHQKSRQEVAQMDEYYYGEME